MSWTLSAAYTASQLSLANSPSTCDLRSGVITRLSVRMYLGVFRAELLLINTQQWSLVEIGASCTAGLYSLMFVQIKSSLAFSLVLKSIRL